MPLNGGIWGIENQFDIVRATFSDGTNVPRIPPVRVGGGLFWRDANWLTRINLLHAFAQNDIAPIGETPTAGYNLLKAEVSYRTKLDPSWFGAREMTVGLVGNNLLNENIRNSVSYNKDQVLHAGHRRARVCQSEVLEHASARWGGVSWWYRLTSAVVLVSASDTARLQMYFALRTWTNTDR